MKTTALILLASAQFALGAITVSNAAMSRNAGQNIPVTITSDRPTIAYIWLYNAKTWTAPIEPLAFDIKLNKGANELNIPIPFSYEATGGNYMLRVTASSGLPAWGSNLIRIRSAIIWPYGGQTFTRGTSMSVTWTPSYINADILHAFLINVNTSDDYQLDSDYIEPYEGRFQFIVPTEIPAGRYRVQLEGFIAYYEPTYYDAQGIFYSEPVTEEVFLDLSEQATGEIINIH